MTIILSLDFALSYCERNYIIFSLAVNSNHEVEAQVSEASLTCSLRCPDDSEMVARAQMLNHSRSIIGNYYYEFLVLFA